METPRRAGTSNGNREDFRVAIGDYAVHDLFRCGDSGACFCVISKVCDTVFDTHERLQMIQENVRITLPIVDEADRLAF